MNARPHDPEDCQMVSAPCDALAPLLMGLNGCPWCGRGFRSFVALHLLTCGLVLCTVQGRASPNRHDMNHRTIISKANKERNAEVERVQAELVDARQLLEKQRMQWQGAVSRRKVMEDEVSQAGMQVWLYVWSPAAAGVVRCCLGRSLSLVTQYCNGHATCGRACRCMSSFPLQPPSCLPPAQAASLRQKLQIVLKKTANDDSLITALRNELALISAAGRGGEDSVEQ